MPNIHLLGALSHDFATLLKPYPCNSCIVSPSYLPSVYLRNSVLFLQPSWDWSLTVSIHWQISNKYWSWHRTKMQTRLFQRCEWWNKGCMSGCCRTVRKYPISKRSKTSVHNAWNSISILYCTVIIIFHHILC